jgi:hypothetical protein
MYARMASTTSFRRSPRSNRARFAQSQRPHRMVWPFFLSESGRPARLRRGGDPFDGELRLDRPSFE